ncbi:uncharacterized protein LOC116434747 isoform X2 [Nomia melanderi]|uniref:uncharacterized protein LOC116434747 isoform X2 n=1 Tax=Nomia melanderi TaxID=2448451 RepID=UPI0013045D55|nr:uncharacterized protein LOC116434747 isoform X2 [Nomia melanderi]
MTLCITNMTIIQIVLWIACCELQLAWSQTTIPEYLKECYTGDAAFNSSRPLNLRVVIDIIQKLERQSSKTMDMRVLSSSLLHRFKFDGIEYQKNVHITNGILPFRATGRQRIRQRLVEELIPGNAEILPVNVLSFAERCTLHQAISNTILQHDVQCRNGSCREVTDTEDLPSKHALTDTFKYLRQQGVILTPYGTVAPGTIIGAVAASLQQQNVPVNQLVSSSEASPLGISSTMVENLEHNEEEINFTPLKSEMNHELSMWYHALMTSFSKLDNMWLTTIAGELAEMTVYQGPFVGQDMNLGATGFWNNTMWPTVYYLTSSHKNFDATRAELMGGIDGLIIAKNLQSWIQDFQSLRLSQILEMYYSYEGIAFNTNIKACNRAQNFVHVVSNTILNEQTYAAAEMLAYRNSVAYISPEALQKMVNFAIKAFYNYTEKHMFPELPCQQVDQPRVETLIAFDGTWSTENTRDFLALLTQNLDVSMYGSKMGIIHGTSGEWLLNVTNSPSLVFDSLNNFTNALWPTQLNYTRVLETIFDYLNKTWEANRNRYAIGNLGQVVVLLSPVGSMSSIDKQSAVNILQQIKNNHPDVHFVYFTSQSNKDLFESFILSAEDHLISNSNINSITQYITTIPRSIRPIISPNRFDVLMDVNNSKGITPRFEDYASPSKSITYRLHSRGRQNIKKIPISIHTFGYGAMKVCSWIQFKQDEKENYHCMELAGHKEITLFEDFKCGTTSPCPDMYFQIQNVTSSYKCAEIDCRTPDQVRFIIRTQIFYDKNSADQNVMLASLIFSLLFVRYIII